MYVMSPGTGAGAWSLCSHRQFRPRSPWGRPPLHHPEMLADPRSTMALCPGGDVGAWRVGAQNMAHPELTGAQHIWWAPRFTPSGHQHALVACLLGMGVAGPWRGIQRPWPSPDIMDRQVPF